MVVAQNTLFPVASRETSTIVMTGTPQAVSVDLSLMLSPNELFGLYQKIRNIHSERPLNIIQFVSAYPGEGANLIAFELAIVAATQIGLRVLFIDSSVELGGARKKLASFQSVPLSVLLQMGGVYTTAMVMAAGTSLVYSALRWRGNGGLMLSNLEDLGKFLDFVRPSYDLIVLATPGVQVDPLSASLARFADGTVMVVEAGKTRSHVVSQTKQLVETNGGNVIGSILNKRRYFIPQWLYGLL